MADRCICTIPGRVTVGCRRHHLMADGTPAADHEVSCICNQFADDRECETWLNEDDEPLIVCGECKSWAREEPNLRLDSAAPSTSQQGDGQ